MVSFVFVLRVKSEDVAGDTGDVDTVTVTASLETALSSAVTLLVPPSSPIEDLLSARDTVGVSSSSVMVPVAVSVAVTLAEVPDTARPTVKVSLASATVSSVVETVKSWVSPAVPANVRALVFSV